MEKKALGRGLEALLPEKFIGRPEAMRMEEVDPAHIIPNRYQPRKSFDEAGLKELAASVKARGVVEPILVRRVEGGRYELIAGERRWRAASMSGRSTLPAIVMRVSESEALELALVENLLRKDLNPMEAAQAYRRLADEFGLTQEEIARAVGKDRSSIANSLRLLSLPEPIRADLLADRLTLGHAKALLSLSRASEQIRVGRQVVRGALSVRETEALVKQGAKRQRRQRLAGGPRPEVAHLQEQLGYRLGTKVRLAGGPTRGRIVVDYYTPEDLERISEIILQ